MTETYRDLFENAQALTLIARKMHVTGIPIEMDRREAHRKRLVTERDIAGEKFRQLTKFNGDLPTSDKLLDSHKQLGEVFFGPKGFGVEPKKFSEKTGGAALDKAVIRDLLGHSIAEVRLAAEHLLSYRQNNTTVTRYIGQGYYGEPGFYGLQVLRETGRHHPNFGVCAAETMRFTCKGGAQQIQKDQYAENKEGKIVVVRQGARDIFVAPPGWLWLESDYSALELREYALYGAIPEWLERFDAGQDVHKFNTSLMLVRPEEKINKQERDVGKTCTFGGIAYGGKAATVHGQVVNKYPRLKVEMVEEFQRNLFQRLPRIPAYQREAISEAKNLGYTPLATGDRIWWKFPGFHNDAGRDEMFGEPKATDILNKRMQRTAARIINAAMVKVWEQVDPTRCHLILQLHDALHHLVREDYVFEAAKITKKCMERELSWTDQWGTRKVQLPVEQKFGPSWGEAKEEIK